MCYRSLCYRSVVVVLHLFFRLAKPPLSALVAGNSLMQVGLTEVWPICVTEIEFRVGYLPKQVVADPQLAASTYEQVGVGHEVGSQMACYVFLAYRVNLKCTLGNFAGYGSYSLSYLPS